MTRKAASSKPLPTKSRVESEGTLTDRLRQHSCSEACISQRASAGQLITVFLQPSDEVQCTIQSNESMQSIVFPEQSPSTPPSQKYSISVDEAPVCECRHSASAITYTLRNARFITMDFG